MSEFREKLQTFLHHYDKLNSLGEDADEGFNSEFQKLKQETQHYKENNTFPAEAGQQPYNKKKNRFKDILPYEYTRVQLHKTENIEGSDYINANYVQGADNSVSYIAAQGPLPHTVEDFWRMLWYHQIEIVVMACKLVEVGRRKCEQYWPATSDESQMFGAIKVTLLNEESISNDFTIRELLAECQGERQVIRQYHYNAWPDHGRPSSALPIIRMVERIGDHRKRHDIPVIVHCSAGCGRTGTIIAIDFARAILLSEEISDNLNVYNIVHDMRRQRPSMVQAKEQYVFVYVAIVELVKRILENIPQAPPKQLNFEKKDVPIPIPTNVDENIYANLSGLQLDDNPLDLEHKRSSNSSLELLSPSRITPPKPLARTSSSGRTEKPLTRTLSGGRSETPPTDGKPSPPLRKPKPLDRPIPIRPVRTDTSKPEPAPRNVKKSDNVPIPIPRKSSPVPPSMSTPPITTPTDKGYANVPNSPIVESTYSIVQKPSTLPRDTQKPLTVPKETSTPKGPKSANTSNSSILDMFMTEIGDILPDINEAPIVTNTDTPPPIEPLSTYALLGSVSQDEIPPDIPVKTAESTQFIVGDTTSTPSDESLMNTIYELPDIKAPIITQTQPSTGLAFSTTINKPTEDITTKPTRKGVGLFNKKSKAEKKVSIEDNKFGTHPGLGRLPSAPAKGTSQTAPFKRGGANDRFQFPGELGFGVRVGKPKGPRPIPSHWCIPNGLIH